MDIVNEYIQAIKAGNWSRANEMARTHKDQRAAFDLAVLRWRREKGIPLMKGAEPQEGVDDDTEAS